MKEITITKREEGQRFDKFLIKYLPGASSGFLHKMLRKKNIKLNGKKAEERERKKSKLKNGEADQRKATNYFGHFTRPLTVRQSSYSISGGFRCAATLCVIDYSNS